MAILLAFHTLSLDGKVQLSEALQMYVDDIYIYMAVSENRDTPKSSILIRFSIINHPFWGIPIFGNIHIYVYIYIFMFALSSHRPLV